METTTKTIVSEVQVPVKETKWHKFWQRMSGNKTMTINAIFTIVLACPIPEPYKAIALSVLGLLGGKTLYHHVTKNGGFKRSVKGVIIE